MPISHKKKKNHSFRGLLHPISVSVRQELEPFLLVFVYEGENFEQKQLGTVFGIVKIEDHSPESSFVVNLLASVIKKEFFSHPDRPTYDSFEASLRKANLALAEIARQGSVKWLGKIDFAGGALEKNNLHFSKLGNTAILLSRSGILADISANLEADSVETNAHPIKTFSDISSGKLENGDSLIFTTNDLLEIFSLEEIRQNLNRFNREEFPKILSASLTANAELAGTIVLDIIPEEEVVAEIKKGEIELDFPSIAPPHPNKKTIIPEKIPTASPKIARIDIFPASPPSPKPSEKNDKLYISESDEIYPKNSFYDKIKKQGKIFSQFAKLFSKSTSRKTFSLFRLIAKPKIFAPKKLKNINWRKFFSKKAVAILFSAIFLIAVSIYIQNRKSDSSSTPETISQNPSPAAALEDINIKKIDNFQQLAEISTDSEKIDIMGDSLYILAANSMTRIKISSGESKYIPSSFSAEKFKLMAPMPDLNTIFILSEDKKIISFTPINNRFQENSISLPVNFKPADMKTYLTYLYLMDASTNQILRFPRAEGGFGEGQNWLKSGSDIKNAIGFSINENILIANTEKITPYLQGKVDNKINFESPQTPLAVDTIFSNPDLKNIYLLDNKNHRVVAFDKDGKIVAQYFNASISQIKSFAVDEENKKIYLQKTGSIEKFSIE